MFLPSYLKLIVKQSFSAIYCDCSRHFLHTPWHKFYQLLQILLSVKPQLYCKLFLIFG